MRTDAGVYTVSVGQFSGGTVYVEYTDLAGSTASVRLAPGQEISVKPETRVRIRLIPEDSYFVADGLYVMNGEEVALAAVRGAAG